MAFRIHDNVVRGEIDNRVKGIVRGRIWLEGRAEPIVLELKGNAWPDLAGCLLAFSNPQERINHQQMDSLHPVQRGSIGDLTASRKVRVYDVPLEDALAMIGREEKPPEHMANSLYLEWFRQKDPEEEWDEHDYEKFLKESDARTDKYMELLEKYGDSAEAEAKIAKEMGWDQELTEEEAEEESRRMDEINAACAEALKAPEPEPEAHREGIDWIRTADGDLRHPLQHRCFESAMKFWHQADDLSSGVSGDKDVEQFIFEFQTFVYCILFCQSSIDKTNAVCVSGRA